MPKKKNIKKLRENAKKVLSQPIPTNMDASNRIADGTAVIAVYGEALHEQGKPLCAPLPTPKPKRRTLESAGQLRIKVTT